MVATAATPSDSNAEPNIMVYCPACGEDGGAMPIDVLSPGNMDWTCQACETVFRIEIGFVPQREADDDST